MPGVVCGRVRKLSEKKGQEEGGLAAGANSTGESQSKATLAPARFFSLFIFYCRASAHDRSRRGRSADTAE